MTEWLKRLHFDRDSLRTVYINSIEWLQHLFGLAPAFDFWTIIHS